MSEDPAFAQQCFFSAIDRIQEDGGVDYLLKELANYLDATGEGARALAVRSGYPDTYNDCLINEVAEHFGVKSIEELTLVEWVAVPANLNVDTATELFEAYAEALS